ncbi:MAG: OmpA family protein [Alphaproteobacteria bacterium]|nr:OmpA family protein [Alphaproteobacteria bacterium]
MTDKLRSAHPAYFNTLGLALAASLFTLAGCSQVPDEVNPVEWYKGVDSWLSDDEAYAEAPPSALEPTLERERVAAADESFPNLSDVPARPPAYDPESAAEISEGLVADRAHAKYSDETIRFQSEADTALAIQSGRQMRKLAEAPPPKAAPRSPVMMAGELSSATSVPKGVSERIDSPEAAMRVTAPPPPPVLTAEARPAPPVALRQPRSIVPSPPPMVSRPLPQSPMVAAPLNIPASDVVPSLPYFPTAAPELNQTMQKYFMQSGAPTLPANFQPQAAAAPVAGGLPSVQVPENGSMPAVSTPLPAPKALMTKSNADSDAPRSLAEYSPNDTGMSIRVATVGFGVGSSSLDEKDRALLKDVVGMFRQNGKSLRVIGHASSRTRDLDPTEHQLANFNISVDRANSVAKELMRQGISGDRIFVGARSDSEPIYYEVMPSGEAGNRRTEIYIDY